MYIRVFLFIPLSMVSFFKKHWSTVALLVFVALLFIPQTGTPIKVFFNRLIAFSPSEIAEADQESISDYNWQLQDLQGNTVDFASAKDKVILVNVWATWCPPCIAEMSSMQALYTTYKDEVSFYFVSIETTETVQKFIDKNEYTFPVFTTQHNFPKVLETNSFPTTYLISKDGKIIMNKKGAADWNSTSVHKTIDALLAE